MAEDIITADTTGTDTTTTEAADTMADTTITTDTDTITADATERSPDVTDTTGTKTSIRGTGTGTITGTEPITAIREAIDMAADITIHAAAELPIHQERLTTAVIRKWK